VEVASKSRKDQNPLNWNQQDILQIKGKQNRAPNPEYLPYVQDFVKSGKWGEVGDLGNTGLTDVRKGLPPGSRDAPIFTEMAKIKLGEGPYYDKTALDNLWNEFVGKPNEGGR